MKAVFLTPHTSSFGEALHGARLASSLVDRGWEVDFLAPSALAPIFQRDRRVRYARIDRAIHRLDLELVELARDLLVLVDATATDKVVHMAGLSHERVLSSAKTVVSLDCWNHSATSLTRDYGPWREILNPSFFERTPLLRPVPFVLPTTSGAYGALPTITPALDVRRTVRQRFGLAENDKIVLWPMASWQHEKGQGNRALIAIAKLLPSLVVPILDRVGPDVKFVHVSPIPLDEESRPKSYLHAPPMSPDEFDDVLAASDALWSFNASATSLGTALALGIPTCLCTARDYGNDPRFRALELSSILVGANPPPIWLWPLSMDSVMAPLVQDNPFYATMARADVFRGDEIVETLRRILFDDNERARIRVAQEDYRQLVLKLPTGIDRLLACIDQPSP